jgi:hypothetical protein
MEVMKSFLLLPRILWILAFISVSAFADSGRDLTQAPRELSCASTILDTAVGFKSARSKFARLYDSETYQVIEGFVLFAVERSWKVNVSGTPSTVGVYGITNDGIKFFPVENHYPNAYGLHLKNPIGGKVFELNMARYSSGRLDISGAHSDSSSFTQGMDTNDYKAQTAIVDALSDSLSRITKTLSSCASGSDAWAPSEDLYDDLIKISNSCMGIAGLSEALANFRSSRGAAGSCIQAYNNRKVAPPKSEDRAVYPNDYPSYSSPSPVESGPSHDGAIYGQDSYGYKYNGSGWSYQGDLYYNGSGWSHRRGR